MYVFRFWIEHPSPQRIAHKRESVWAEPNDQQDHHEASP